MNSNNAKEIIKLMDKIPDVVVKNIKCKDKDLSLIFFKSMISEEKLISGVLKPIIDFNAKVRTSPNSKTKKENEKHELKNEEKKEFLQLEYNNNELLKLEFKSEEKESNEKSEVVSKGEITLDYLQTQILITSSIDKLDEFDKMKEALLRNKVLLFVDGEESCLAIDLEEYPVRLPSEPPTSAVIKGPREGFVEDIKTNLTLLRRRFASENFTYEELTVGKYSQTRVIIAYLNGITDKFIVRSIKNKIAKINIDGVIDSYYILKFLEDKKHSLFKQVGSCEKPDIVASKMLEGRVAVIVDNSPIVLTLPFLYIEDLQSANDYYSSHHYTTFIRLIRLFGIIMSILVPGFYLAIIFYHYNIIPYNFLITIGNSTQNIPLTPFLEIVFILTLFQLLYEVSLRLPQYLGLATSIVGALILGDTGVKAGLISPPGVMIIALSMISIYTVPDQADQLNLLRAVFIIIGGGLGLFGIIGATIFIFGYLNSLENYGTPYLAPYAPIIKSDMKDSLFKVAVVDMTDRPKSIPNKKKVRLKK